MKKQLLILIIAFVFTKSYTQEVKAHEENRKSDIVLTGDEKFSVRTGQFNRLILQEELAIADANLKLSIAQVYKNHNVTQEAYSLCAGPGTGVCEEAPKDDIVMKRNQPKVGKDK